MSEHTPYRILLVDDQESIHEDYRKVLGPQVASTAELDQAAADLFDDQPEAAVEWTGFELDSAFQGKDGYELVQRSIAEGRRYAAAFVDIRMPPGWDGVHTVRKIWEVDPEILVVLCSAYSDYSWEDIVGQLGRNDRFLILKKPFDNIEVRQAAMVLTERWSVSRTDVLTGLLNRRAFHEHARLEWSRAARYGLELSCAMLDLDFFKRINDVAGHSAGDLVLQSIADRLRAKCRGSDVICRHGGEEICVLLPHTSEENAASWAEHVRHAIASMPVVVDGQSLKITASIGVSSRLTGNDSVEKLIDRADQAMIVSKRTGRNQVTTFSAIAGSLEDTGREATNDLLHNFTAGQVVGEAGLSISEHTSVSDAVNLILRSGNASIPVVDDHGLLVGVLSEKNVFDLLPSPDALQMPVSDITQRNVVCYEDNTPLSTIYDFLSRGMESEVVIVREGRPTGIVDHASLLRWYQGTLVSPSPTSVSISPIAGASNDLNPSLCLGTSVLSPTQAT